MFSRSRCVIDRLSAILVLCLLVQSLSFQYGSGSGSTPALGFTGEYTDASTGLVNLRARQYNPQTGLFLTRDPVAGTASRVMSRNGYSYTEGNPANYTDPSGKFLPLLLAALGGAAVGGIAGGMIGEFGDGADSNLAADSNDPTTVGDTSSTGSNGTTCSFSANTLVDTPTGETPISQLKVGDQVVAYNQDTGTTGSYKVDAVLVHTDVVLEDVTLDGEVLHTTPEHPFYTADRGWVSANELQVGEQVRMADGSYGTVKAFKQFIQPETMYNLTVDQAYTFFVGDGQWLVHNMCPETLKPDVPQFSKQVENWLKEFQVSVDQNGFPEYKTPNRDLIRDLEMGTWNAHKDGSQLSLDEPLPANLRQVLRENVAATIGRTLRIQIDQRRFGSILRQLNLPRYRFVGTPDFSTEYSIMT